MAAATSFVAADTAPAAWRVAPREEWVRDLPAATAQLPAASGVLLHDRQIRITASGDDRYEHTVERIAVAATPEQATQVYIVIDPRFQDLAIHSLRLTHADGTGKTFSASQIREQVRVQPGEADAHKRDLNPQLQVSIQVPGTRVGDQLECEYTIHSVTARFAGLVAGHYAAQWPTGGDQPVHWERLHVTWPAARALRYRIVGGASGVTPTIDTHPGELDLQWREQSPAATEADIPRWFERRSTVELSDFSDWMQVAAVLAPRYARPGDADPHPQEKLDQPTALATPGLILNAVRLVQSKVHAINLAGVGVYTPAEPAAVLQRGYGDSRDIARLLVALLTRVGIDAQVALAETRGTLLDSALPSPFVLDAALVVARAGTTEYWLNPDAPGPATQLGTTDPSDLRRALLLAATNARVVALPRAAPDSRLRVVTQQFDLRAGNTQPAALTMTTRFRGGWAQAVRAELLAQSPAQLQLTQIQSVAQDYASATAVGQVQLQDLPDAQALQLTSHFRIPKPFADPQQPEFNFFAEALTEAVQPRDEPTRRFPLSLPWPLQIEEHISAALPADFAPLPSRMVIETAAFRYVRNVRFARGALQIDHSYVALNDHVDPADYPQFLQANAQVYQALGLTIAAQGFSWSRLLAWLGGHSLAIIAAAAVTSVVAASWWRLRRE